jgi:TusA-related sulfurtransferase
MPLGGDHVHIHRTETMEAKIRINARNLSNPGPRLLVENALSKGSYERMRVIVSSPEAAEDVKALFLSKGADVEVEQLVEEYHVLAIFSGESAGSGA